MLLATKGLGQLMDRRQNYLLMTNNQVSLSRQQIKTTLAALADVFSELINNIGEEIEQGAGADPVGLFVQCLHEDGTYGWAALYTDPQNEQKAAWLAALPPDKINAMVGAIAAMSPEQQTSWLDRLFTEGGKAIAPVVDAEADRILEIWPEVAESTLGIQWLTTRRCFVMATLFNGLAAMQTGKTMYQLVAEAVNGNDDSYLKAVQIDKTVLDVIPYFAERNRYAADIGDLPFLRRLQEHRNKPLTVTRLRYVKLWLVFDALDHMNVLEQFEEDLQGFAELCQSIRVYGPHPDVDAVDLEDFKSRLDDFKRTRHPRQPKPKSIIHVKDVSSANSPP